MCSKLHCEFLNFSNKRTTYSFLATIFEKTAFILKVIGVVKVKKSKIFSMSTLFVILLVGMSACSNSSSDVKSPENESKADNISQNTDDSSQSNESSTEYENGDNNSSGSTLSENRDSSSGDKKDKGKLSEYSSEEIEYARVWLQLGPNQDIDELNVQHISAGTSLNPDDNTSATYPEDVIQLAGSRLVDGVVTYSGNGDGTINVYNVPLRWDGNYPAGEKFYIDIINNTKLVSIDTGDDEKIIKLITLLNIHH